MALLSFCRFSRDPGALYTSVFTMGLSQVLFEATRTWVWYMALEPLVRRVWPQILITSSRLLDGRFHDPLVGRDILAGAAFGVFVTILLKLKLVLHNFLGESVPLSGLFSHQLMEGIPELIGTAALAHGVAIFMAFFIMMILLVNRTVFRSERGALIATQVGFASLTAALMGGSLAIAIPVAMIMVSTVLFLLVRFGMLALLSFFTCRMLLDFFPLTFDTSRWYFANGFAAPLLIASMAALGCYFATANRSTRQRANS